MTQSTCMDENYLSTYSSQPYFSSSFNMLCIWILHSSCLVQPRIFNIFITIGSEISPSVFCIFRSVLLMEYVNIYQICQVLWAHINRCWGGYGETVVERWMKELLKAVLCCRFKSLICNSKSKKKKKKQNQTNKPENWKFFPNTFGGKLDMIWDYLWFLFIPLNVVTTEKVIYLIMEHFPHTLLEYDLWHTHLSASLESEQLFSETRLVPQVCLRNSGPVCGKVEDVNVLRLRNFWEKYLHKETCLRSFVLVLFVIMKD